MIKMTTPLHIEQKGFRAKVQVKRNRHNKKAHKKKTNEKTYLY